MALLQKDTEALAALTAQVLPLEPTMIIMFPMLELPAKPLLEEALFYSTQLTAKTHFFFPPIILFFLQETESNQSCRLPPLFFPPN